MLLLGAVGIFEPVNGYQIRRELTSWQVDRWAHLNPGSIYGGLTTLARQGHLARHELVDGGREVTVYELTGSGRTELERLTTTALETVELYDRSDFMAAFSMYPSVLPADLARRSLVQRRVHLEATLAEFTEIKMRSDAVPPHVLQGALLWYDVTVAELGWLREVVDELATGTRPEWEPPAGDPGWQMAADRERYREILDRADR
ncbi:PadR family transcriptional regulator [Nocardioides anomalus]|uniref:PadR family transcriptional regulator n=1 Tax=Nocardioides anomalus TaxID=2712223 RepID=A0A6G6WLS8_9ACTN|nr:PadR family transcriptional regulator [Nocardioides anomalus]